MDTTALSAGSEQLVSIVVLNWNGADDTLVCLGALSALAYPKFNVIVVDNGSTDDSLSRLRHYEATYPLTLLVNTRNLGYAGGNNIGLRAALGTGAEFILVLNNDTEVAPNLISELVSAANRAPCAAVVGPWMYYYDRRDVLWFAGAAWESDALAFRWPGQGVRAVDAGPLPMETDYVCGAAMLFRREALERIGLFDERFFLVYEESDWCFRARSAGYACLMAPSGRIWHKIGASFGSEQSPLRAYFSARNQLLWAAKNLDSDSYRRLRRRMFVRQLPQFRLGTSGAPLMKRMAWSISQLWRDALRMWRDPVQKATRHGLRDYLLRSFGDCPESIRLLNATWAQTQRAERTAAPTGALSSGLKQ
jgi:GT2 family glycosyltransferase